MYRRSRTWRSARAFTRALTIAAALAALGIVAAACGSSPGAGVANLGGSATTTSPTTTPSGGNSSQTSSGNSGSSQSHMAEVGVTVQLAECMRTHGVPNYPDPNSQGVVQMTGINPGSASYQAAEKDCAKYEPNGGKPPTAAQTAQAEAQGLKYSECMRAHGITDFPDPQSGPGGGIRISLNGSAGSDLDPHNPRFQAAMKACQSESPFKKLAKA